MSDAQPVPVPARVPPAPRGRGSAAQPANRFALRRGGERRVDFRHEPLEVEAWADDWDPGFARDAGGRVRVRTTYLRDRSRSIVAWNDSPDIPFDASVNPYRGCEHGCAYCYARPTHEFLGMSAGLDFESRILVKTDAPRLLRATLGRPGWSPQPIALSGVTDPYQPIERHLRLTRGCLEVLAAFRNPVAVITKSHLVARDLDVLRRLAQHGAASVALSITTLDATLARALEPRAPGPAQRLHAIHQLAEAGIPVGVMVAPVIPGLTDAEVPAILAAAAEAGAGFAGTVVLRLPHGVSELFLAWLDRHAPARKAKVVARLEDLRRPPEAAPAHGVSGRAVSGSCVSGHAVSGSGVSGSGVSGSVVSGQAADGARPRLNDPGFGSRMRGHGPYAQQLHDLFHLARRRAGLARGGPHLSTAAFRRQAPAPGQLELF